MQKRGINLNLKVLCQLAMLTAISIVAGKYLAIGVGTVLRFSLENLPIIFSGLAFGPTAGLLVGVVADLVGCLLVGYEINPIVTVGAAFIGLLSGTAKCIPHKSRGGLWLTVILGESLAHLIGSVVVKTFGLAVYYDMPFMILMLWRLLNYALIGALETVLIYALLKNRAVQREINTIKNQRN